MIDTSWVPKAEEMCKQAGLELYDFGAGAKLMPEPDPKNVFYLSSHIIAIYKIEDETMMYRIVSLSDLEPDHILAALKAGIEAF